MDGDGHTLMQVEHGIVTVVDALSSRSLPGDNFLQLELHLIIFEFTAVSGI
jgi:hypothetical protein